MKLFGEISESESAGYLFNKHKLFLLLIAHYFSVNVIAFADTIPNSLEISGMEV